MSDPINIAQAVLDAISAELGPQWIVKEVVAMFTREDLAALLEAEYKAAEVAAEVAEKEAFPNDDAHATGKDRPR